MAELVFNDGYALDAETLLLASRAADELDEAESYLAILSKGQWRFIGFDDVVVSVACLNKLRQGFFLAQSGRVLVTGIGKRVVENVPTDETLGDLIRIRNISEELYVCGMSGQVYRRNDGNWRAIDKSIRGIDQLDFEDIGGTGPTNIYAVSSFGQIVHYDGASWRILDLPSNQSLSGIKVVSEKKIYVCGNDGLVLRGTGPQHWEVISGDSFDYSLISLEWYLDRLYAAHCAGLLEWSNGKWREVEFGLEGDVDCQMLQARDGLLFSFGYEHVLVFDGIQWRRIVPQP